MTEGDIISGKCWESSAVAAITITAEAMKRLLVNKNYVRNITLEESFEESDGKCKNRYFMIVAGSSITHDDK